MLTRLHIYAREVIALMRESATPVDFWRVLRVRLSSSKLGPLVCRRPVVVRVRLRSMGAGVVLRSHATDISVLMELLVAGTYREAARLLPPEPGLIVDLGANTGLAARWLAHRFPSARLVCVEPEEGNLAVLDTNLEPLGGRATVVRACVGGHRRKVRLVTDNGSFAFRMTEDEAPGVQVDVVMMTDVLSDELLQIDLLKCDVEGAEREIFASCDGWISRVEAAVVECHAPYSAASLVADVESAGARAVVTELIETPEFGCEVVTFRLGPA